jgi:HAD superfamily phosphoserine phosphatase-like hydrolase
MIRKKLIKRTVILDLDGTLVNVDCFKLFLIKILMHSPSRWIYIPLLIINVIFFYLNPQYTRTRLKLFFLKIIIKDQRKIYIEKQANSFANFIIKFKLNKQIFNYIKIYQQQKFYIVLATGSLNVYALEIASLLGINYVISSKLSGNQKTYDGFFLNDNCVGKVKFEAINKFLKNNNINWSETIFFSDHHSDLPIFKKSKINFAVKPTSLLTKELKKNNINHEVIN